MASRQRGRTRTTGRKPARATPLFLRHPVPTWIHDPATLDILEVNEAAVRQYGYSRPAFLKLTTKALGLDADAFRQAFTGTDPVIHQSHRSRSGALLSVRCRVRRIIHDGRRAVLVTAEPVTTPSDGLIAAFERISDGVVALDRNWTYTYVNHQAGQILGREPGTLIGRNIWEVYPEGVGQKFHLAYERAMRTGEAATIEEYYPPFDRWFENRIHPSPEGLTIYFRDVTPRKQAEIALRESEERLRLAMRAANQGLYDLNVRTGEARVSPEYAEMLGYDPATFRETNSAWIERLHPEDREPVAAVYRDYIAGRLPEYRVEFRQQTRSGHWLWILSVGSIVERSPDGQPLRMLGTHTDISALKESQIALAHFKRTLDQTLDSVFIFDADDLRFRYVNEGGKRQVGYSEEELLAMRPMDLKPDIAESEFRALLGSLRDGSRAHVYLQTRHRHKDGHHIPVEVVIQLVEGPGIGPRFVAVVRDVTERQQAEEAIRRSEENLAITLQSIGDAVIATDAERRITRMNPAAERLTGWGLAEAIGQPLDAVFRIVDAETREPVTDPGRIVLERAETVGLANHTVLLARDGRELQIADSAAPIQDSKGRIAGVVLVFSDVTEQYRTQQALRERERHLRTIIDTEPECLKVVAGDGRLLQMNSAGLAMLEAESFEEVARHRLDEYLLPAYRPAFRDLHRRVMGGERGVLEFEVTGLRGTRRWLETHAAPLPGEGGEGTVLLGVTRDITARKEAEAARERAEEQLRQAEKMEAVGRLAGGVAHDFNNLLTVINSIADLALESGGAAGAIAEDLREIRRAGERAAALTGQLLAFSRTEIVAPEVLDPNAVLAEMQPLLDRVIREDIRLEVIPAADLKRVRIDRGQLDRVIMNLALNARDAMPAGGSLLIETRNVEFEQPPLDVTPPLAPGAYVQLSFRDTGEGMSAETRARVFEPFFTTKGVGQGTGLGLASVYGIAASCHGGVSVESSPGQGATFRVYLPPATTAAPAPGAQAAEPPGTGHETILIVDDEVALVRVAARILRHAGYTVLTATTGAEALRLLEAHPGNVDLLMSDVVMPGMSGPELAARAMAIRPGLRVLYASGYSDDVLLRGSVQEKRGRFLSKPYTTEALRRHVREALGGAGGTQ